MITDGGEEGFMNRILRWSLVLGERCRCVLSFSFPKHHLILNTLDPRCYTRLHARQTVVPPVRIGDSPLIFGNTCVTETNQLRAHRARPGPHPALGSRLVIHRRAPPRRKLCPPSTSASSPPMSCFHQSVARPSAPGGRRLLLPRTTFHQRLDHAPPARPLQQVLGALSNDESKTESEAGVVVLAPVSEAGALRPGISLQFRKE